MIARLSSYFRSIHKDLKLTAFPERNEPVNTSTLVRRVRVVPNCVVECLIAESHAEVPLTKQTVSRSSDGKPAP